MSTPLNDPPSSAQVSVPSSVVKVIVAELPTVPVGPSVIWTFGGVPSWTTTSKLPFAVFPAESVALHDTVVVPSGKLEPDDGEQDGVTGLPPSLAVTVIGRRSPRFR